MTAAFLTIFKVPGVIRVVPQTSNLKLGDALFPPMVYKLPKFEKEQATRKKGNLTYLYQVVLKISMSDSLDALKKFVACAPGGMVNTSVVEAADVL